MQGLFRILDILARHKVEFIVVGAVSANLNGAPISTYDLDIVHRRTEENVQRLLSALAEVDAIYRFPRSRRLPPNASHLISPGHQLLDTRYGMLDVLGEIAEHRAYDDLFPHTFICHIGVNLDVRIVDLPTLIQLKEEANRDKDKVHLLVLRETLKELERTSEPEK